MNEVNSQNLVVREKSIPGYSGRIYGNRIAINKDLSTFVEKSCVLAEELGHYYTSSGDISDQNNGMNRKQERRARAWAYNLYNHQIGLDGLIRAYEYSCRTQFDIAEYLGVTEEFLKEALEYYQGKYDTVVVIGKHIINFRPHFVIGRML